MPVVPHDCLACVCLASIRNDAVVSPTSKNYTLSSKSGKHDHPKGLVIVLMGSVTNGRLS